MMAAMRRRDWTFASRASILFALLALLACASSAELSQWHAALLEADRLFDHARDDDAARLAYLALQKEAPAPELERYIRYRLAALALRSGEPQRGVKLARELVEERSEPRDEWSSQALELLVQDAQARGRADEAARLRSELIARFPESSAALDALEQVLAAFRARGDALGAVQWLAEAYVSLSESGLGDNLLYELALLQAEQLADPEGARQSLEGMLARHPHSPLWDDARWRLAGWAQQAGELREALRQYEKIAEQHDSSWSLGEYDSSLRDDAMEQRALIFVQLGELPAAVEEYERVLAAYPEHWRAARFAFARAQLLRELGEEQAWAEALEALLQAHPESVFAERARKCLAARGGAP